jgi:L-lactate dehydrogenase complex protein LldF
MKHSQSLPYASSLCGACYEVCPVKIDIPEILIHLRGKVVHGGGAPFTERFAMKAASVAFSKPTYLSAAQKLARIGQKPFERDGMLRNLPGILAHGSQFAICQLFLRSPFVSGGRNAGKEISCESR